MAPPRSTTDMTEPDIKQDDSAAMKESDPAATSEADQTVGGDSGSLDSSTAGLAQELSSSVALSSVAEVRSGEAAHVLRASFGSSSQGLVLYDLTNTPAGASSNGFKEFSPHCVKTLLDLRLLNVGYDRQRLTFADIRSRLTRLVGDNAATVPTLELADGRHLTDSWAIAVNIAESHPDGGRLFPNGPVSRAFAASLNNFCKTVLAPNLGPLTRPAVHQILTDEDSRAYFENVKVGRRKLDACRSLSAEKRQAHAEACASSLDVIQSALAAVQETRVGTNPSSHHPLYFEGGEEPTHADFCVYGWYVHTRVAGPAVTRAIWHAKPLVSQWVENLNSFAGPEITGDYC